MLPEAYVHICIRICYLLYRRVPSFEVWITCDLWGTHWDHIWACYYRRQMKKHPGFYLDGKFLHTFTLWTYITQSTQRLGLSGTCKNIYHPSSSVCGLPVFLFLPVSEPLGIALIPREKSRKIENCMATYEEVQLVAQTFHWVLWVFWSLNYVVYKGIQAQLISWYKETQTQP